MSFPVWAYIYAGGCVGNETEPIAPLAVHFNAVSTVCDEGHLPRWRLISWHTSSYDSCNLKHATRYYALLFLHCFFAPSVFWCAAVLQVAVFVLVPVKQRRFANSREREGGSKVQHQVYVVVCSNVLLVDVDVCLGLILTFCLPPEMESEDAESCAKYPVRCWNTPCLVLTLTSAIWIVYLALWIWG